MDQEVVTISAERLRELEAAAEKLREMKDKAKENAKEYKKTHRESNNESKLKQYHKNKDIINEKRRAAYKAKKEAEAAAKA